MTETVLETPAPACTIQMGGMACPFCAAPMQRAGSCLVCPMCGETSGCS